MTSGIDTHRVVTIVKRISQQIRRDRRTLGLMVVAPVVVTFLFAFIFAGTITSVKTAICVDDEPLATTLGNAITTRLESSENVTVLHRSRADAFTGFGSTLQAVLLLPSNLTRGFVLGENTAIGLYVIVTSELQANYILSVLGNATSNAATDMFGSRGVRIDRNITFIVSLPPLGLSLSFNLSIVDEDEGFPETVGAAFQEILSVNGNVSVIPCSTREAVIDSIRSEMAVAGIYVPANFTETLLTGVEPTIELFINGIQSSEVAAALSSIQDAISESFRQILGRGTETSVTYVYGRAGMSMIDLAGPAMIGFLSMFFSFLISGVFFLRERQQGTLERMHASPLSDIEIVLGYVIAFIGVSIVQTTLVSCTILYFSPGLLSSILLVIPLMLLLVVGSVALALSVSYRMKNELQILQMIPMFIIPQMFLSGLLFPLSLLPPYLAFLPYIFPLTYYVMAVKAVVFLNATLLDVLLPMLVLCFYCLLGIGLAIARRSQK